MVRAGSDGGKIMNDLNPGRATQDQELRDDEWMQRPAAL
jgi:hypothetical protein